MARHPALTNTTIRQAADESLPSGRVVYENVSGKALAAVPRDGPVETEEQALAVLESAGKAIESAHKRRRLALEEFPHDPVLVHPLPMTRYSLIQNDSANGGGLWAAYDVASRSDGPVRRRIRQLAEVDGETMARGQARMMLALIENRLEPMNKNASFEQGNAAAADAWSWWVKFGVGRMGRTREVAHEGDFSVLCDGMRRGGPVQQLPIGPGKYGLVCFVYVPEGQSSTGATELSMTLRDAAGVNLPSSSTHVVPGPGRWTALAVAADVPETIGDAVVKFVMPMLVVDGFKPGEKVYFDDLMLYRLEE